MDFSANCNPLGTPESVKQAVRDSLDRTGDYPQVGYAPLREALGEYEEIWIPGILSAETEPQSLYFLSVRLYAPKRP